MKVTVCSAFRSSQSYLGRYFAQMEILRRKLARRGDPLTLVLGEGDHTDDTREKLPGYLSDFDATLMSVDHGGPDHGSIVNAERFANMAKVWNRIWAAIPDDAEAVLFVEADLEWQADMLIGLIDDLHKWPAVAPMIRLQRQGWHPLAFYDNWAFRRDGEHIGVEPPYFPGWDVVTPIQIDSGGTCLAIRGDMARRLAWPPEDVIVGVCRQINELGGSVWLNPEREVVHL